MFIGSMFKFKFKFIKLFCMPPLIRTSVSRTEKCRTKHLRGGAFSIRPTNGFDEKHASVISKNPNKDF